MRSEGRWAVVVFAALSAVPSIAEAADVVAVLSGERREAERATLQTVADRLGDELTIRTATAPTTRRALEAATRATRGAHFALGLDIAAEEIAVRRADDATVLSRPISAEAWRASPYSAALVALELIQLARAAPLEEALPPPPPPPPVVTVSATVASPEPSSWGLYWSAGLQGVIDWSAGNEVTLVRPAASVGVGLAIDPLRLGVELRGAPFGRASAEVQGIGADYVRHDVFAAVVGRYVVGANRWGAGLRVGASFVEVELGSSDGVDDRRALAWGGLEATFARRIASGFAFEGTLAADWVPTPPRFLVLDSPVLYERGLRVHLGLGVRWASR
ncbi:MAG: hypothetical protein RIT81_32560 [Deltaproteobacteria bacterium]